MPGNGTIDVLLVDEYVALREGLALMLERRGCLVVGSVGGATQALKVVDELKPDVAVVGIRLAEGDGLSLARTLRSDNRVEIVLYTGSKDPSTLAAAVATGARGIVLKSGTLDELLQAIRAARRGDRYVDRRLLPQLVPAGAPSKPVLTSREREVLVLLAAGLTGEQAAETMSISPETVRTHIRNATQKLGARTRTEAVVTAWRRREISL